MEQAEMRTTHTYAILRVSAAAYQEIRRLLADAGYEDQFHEDSNHGEVIDMHGIALGEDQAEGKPLEVNVAGVEDLLKKAEDRGRLEAAALAERWGDVYGVGRSIAAALRGKRA